MSTWRQLLAFPINSIKITCNCPYRNFLISNSKVDNFFIYLGSSGLQKNRWVLIKFYKKTNSKPKINCFSVITIAKIERLLETKLKDEINFTSYDTTRDFMKLNVSNLFHLANNMKFSNCSSCQFISIGKSCLVENPINCFNLPRSPSLAVSFYPREANQFPLCAFWSFGPISESDFHSCFCFDVTSPSLGGVKFS